MTAELLAQRFGISWQRANARVRRLRGLGLVDWSHLRTGEPRLVYLSGPGARLLGLPRRRAPRLDIQREHELAIIACATQLELAGETVLTERECRRLEVRGDGRFSAEVAASSRNEIRRWPDLVALRDDGCSAIEIELSPKTTDRLERTIAGYGASHYREVVFLVEQRALRERIDAIIASERDTVTWRDLVPMRTEAWPASSTTGMAA